MFLDIVREQSVSKESHTVYGSCIYKTPLHLSSTEGNLKEMDGMAEWDW